MVQILSKSNQNYFTGKTIDALSPKANPKRFTDKADIEKWLKKETLMMFIMVKEQLLKKVM